MVRIFSFAAVAAVCALLCACGESDAQKEARIHANLKRLGEKYVKARLKDPESAQFQNQFIGIKGAPCGEVNAKNGFGGFIGFKRYISVGAEMTVLEADMSADEFETTWRQICR